MSHRKFEQPRHGHLGYLPRKRCRHIRGRVRSFPIDQPSQEPHLTAFLAYKAGMTHIVRDLDRPGSKMHKKEVCEPVSILDCPAMAVVGIVGYKPSARGMRTVCTVWTQQLSESVLRRYYRSWYAAKKKAFTKHIATYQEKAATEARDAKFARLVKNATVLRVICHTQPNKLKLGQKKAHIAEIQVNGGSMEDKLKFAKGLLENQFTVGQVFKESENCDIIGVTRGHGFEGVAAKCEKGKGNATTPLDITSKHITPLGGFVRYGVVNNEYVMVKGSVPGPSKRVLTLRRPIAPQTH
eukprot:gene17532-26978_t